MAPQIIMIILSVYSLLICAYRHGKKKEGNYSFGVDFVSWLIQIGLLVWGGFFSGIFA